MCKDRILDWLKRNVVSDKPDYTIITEAPTGRGISPFGESNMDFVVPGESGDVAGQVASDFATGTAADIAAGVLKDMVTRENKNTDEL